MLLKKIQLTKRKRYNAANYCINNLQFYCVRWGIKKDTMQAQRLSREVL